MIAGEINDDTASIGVPRLPTPPPPAPIIIADPSHRRRGQVVRVQSPRALEPIVIQAPSSRSSSRSQTYVPHEPVVYQTETRYSRRTDATGRELDSVISDFSSIVIIVCVSLSQAFNLSKPPFCASPGYLPCLSIYRDARVGS